MNAVPVKTDDTIELQVARLLARWREETAYLSSSTAITGHAAYQELTALGHIALPSLFRDLEATGDGHLSRALTAITGANPISAAERGHIRKIAETWLRWAKENGYQPQTAGMRMKTSEHASAIEMDQETPAVIDHLMTGKAIDPEIKARIRQRAEKITEEIRQKHGLVDIAVPSIRELRGN